jgi:hypothetical protein
MRMSNRRMAPDAENPMTASTAEKTQRCLYFSLDFPCSGVILQLTRYILNS